MMNSLIALRETTCRNTVSIGALSPPRKNSKEHETLDVSLASYSLLGSQFGFGWRNYEIRASTADKEPHEGFI